MALPFSSAKGAWVTLVMKGDSYVPGALVLAESLRSVGTTFSTVCMVTDDVSETAKVQLRLVFDIVCVVPYLKGHVRPLKTPSQQHLYGSWMAASFTKMNCLELTVFQKVVFLDADMVVLKNADDIMFNLNAPAANFSHPHAQPYVAKGYFNPYAHIRHGERIPNDLVMKGLTGSQSSFAGFGSVVLLEPNLEHFRLFTEWIATFRDEQSAFGFSSCHSGIDEQSVAYFYAQHIAGTKGVKPWTMIDQRYNYVCWETQWFTPQMNSDARIQHHMSRKPWQQIRSAWPDLLHWWGIADSLSAKHPATLGVYLKALEDEVVKEHNERQKASMAVFLMRSPAATDKFFGYSSAQDALVLEYALDANDFYVRWIRHFEGSSKDADSLPGKIAGAKLVVGFGGATRPLDEIVRCVGQTAGAQLVWVPRLHDASEIKTLQTMSARHRVRVRWIAKSNCHVTALVQQHNISENDIVVLPWSPFVSFPETDRHLRATLKRNGVGGRGLAIASTAAVVTGEPPHGPLLLQETVRILKRSHDSIDAITTSDSPLRPFSFVHLVGYSSHRNTVANMAAVQCLMRKYPEALGQLIVKCTRSKKTSLNPNGRLSLNHDEAAFLDNMKQTWGPSGCQRLVTMSEDHINDTTKAQLYEHCTFAMCCSSAEDSGHILTEAAAFGCVVVAMDCALHRQLLANAPWTIWVKATDGTDVPDVCDIVQAVDNWLIARGLTNKEAVRDARATGGIFADRYTKGKNWMHSRLDIVKAQVKEKLMAV